MDTMDTTSVRGLRLTACAAVILAGAGAARSAERTHPSPILVQRFAESLGMKAGGFASVKVRTVGCPADGQLGAKPAARLPATVDALVRRGDGERLAFYKSDFGGGVLAPRGWKCFASYGSDGSVLLVAPANAPTRLFTLDSGATVGPAVMLTLSEGGTSGRFEAARVAARVFPAARAFAKGVQAEGIEDAKTFVFAPWPKDKNTYLSDRVVAFTTPAGTPGLGSTERLGKSGSAIQGEAALIGPAAAPSLEVLRVRLGGAEADLYASIAVNALP